MNYIKSDAGLERSVSVYRYLRDEAVENQAATWCFLWFRNGLQLVGAPHNPTPRRCLQFKDNTFQKFVNNKNLPIIKIIHSIKKITIRTYVSINLKKSNNSIRFSKKPIKETKQKKTS